MAKIIIISCIIAAVCVFQTAEAGLLSSLPIDSRLPNVGNGMLNMGNGMLDINVGKDLTDMLKHVHDMAVEIHNVAEKAYNDLKSALNESMSQLKSKECLKTHDDAMKTWDKLVSSFNSCIDKEAQSAKEIMPKLMDLLIKLGNKLSKDVPEIYSCFENPLKIPQCISKVSREMTELTPLINDVVSEAGELVPLFKNVRKCNEDAVNSVKGNAGTLITDVQLCVKNVMKPFTL